MYRLVYQKDWECFVCTTSVVLITNIDLHIPICQGSIQTKKSN